MNCRAFQRQIEELSPDCFPSVEAQAHAAACVSCRDFHRQQSSLKNLIQTLEHVRAPQDFDRKLNARLSDAANALSPRPFFYLNFIPGTTSIVFASVFVLAVCSVVLLKETQFLDAPRVAQTQSVAPNVNVPAAVLTASRVDAPADARTVYGDSASADVASKSTNIRLPRKPLATKHQFEFAALRRKERVPEEESKTLKATEPPTKSIIFSSIAAPIVTRTAVTTNLSAPPGTSKSVSEPAQSNVQLNDFFAASGLKTTTLAPQFANSFATRGGLFVVSVQPESAAFRAGLRPNDVIEAANNQLLSGTDAHLPQSSKDNDDFSLTIVRGNQKFPIKLSLRPPTKQ